MPYRITGIDVHKKMLAVVVSDVEVEGEYQFERRLFGSNPEQLRSLAAWLLEQEVEEVVMESTYGTLGQVARQYKRVFHYFLRRCCEGLSSTAVVQRYTGSQRFQERQMGETHLKPRREEEGFAR